MLGRELPPLTPEQAELRHRIDKMYELSDAEVTRILAKYVAALRDEAIEDTAQAA